jgi:hypothetical protein
MKKRLMHISTKQAFTLPGLIAGIFMLFFIPGNLSGQYSAYGGGGYELITPAGGLHERFEAIEVPVLSVGWDVDEKARVILEYQNMNFDRINKEKIPYDTLRMSLKNHSGGLLYQYAVWQPITWTTFYVQAGITLNRWEFKRDAFSTTIEPDSVTTFVPEMINLEPHRRTDWSWGAKVGGGVEMSPLTWFHLGWHINAHLIAAELWPTESLGMESVSGLKMLNHQFYLRLSYAW